MTTVSTYKPVNQFLETPLPSILWQYTSIDSLLGMIKEKRLWASDIRYLNDAAEFNHGMELVKSRVESLRDQAGSDANVNELIASVISSNLAEGLFSTLFEKNELYVASFSTLPDQLSQWRAYAAQGRGVSLGFDLTGLRPPSTVETLAALAPCIYKDDEKVALLDAIFDVPRRSMEDFSAAIATDLGDWTKPVASNQAQSQADIQSVRNKHYPPVKKAFDSLSLNVLRVVSFFKHHTFHEESEWRYFAPILQLTSPTIVKRFTRTKDHRLIPTVSFPFGPQTLDQLPLKRVIVGPGTDHESTATAIKTALRWNQLSHVDVTLSEIPYRNW